MILQIPEILNAAQVRMFRDRLGDAGHAWVDGRVTAGHQGAAVKRNRQLGEDTPLARELGDTVLAALERHPQFISAALPNHVYPPLFNRYEAGMQFGSHVDGAIRHLPGSALKIRTDLSATLFLSAAESYDGGELEIEDTYGVHSAKLGAGDLLLYPSTSLHRVAPVTRGVRLACVFWVQSLVADDAQRTVLYDMDCALQALDAGDADLQARTRLTGCYHNLLRMWSKP